ncbi:MAG: hydroxymethylbilane synthase [Erythrobacter sp.]|nr:hydroxymethylbilane synthase [Erythrobacter sp.]
MTQQTILKLGTRRSPLALAQAEETRARLCALHGWDSNRIELVPVLASGDKVTDRPLADVGGKALWTKELDEWLAQGSIHAAVHSLKDVETIRPQSLVIAAVLPRADKRDRLVFRQAQDERGLDALPHGATVGTSAPRRAAQLLNLRPDCRVVTFRGNVATRLGKLTAGEADATFLAAAGLSRLGQDTVGVALETDDWLPAPAQGAIAVECRADDAQTRELLAVLDHAPSRAEVMAERALLAALGGGCNSPIGVVCNHVDGALAMRAALFSPAGQERVEGAALFAADHASGPQKLAEDLLGRATSGITALFTGPTGG